MKNLIELNMIIIIIIK